MSFGVGLQCMEAGCFQSTRSSVRVLGHPALCVGLIRAQAPAAHSLPCVAVPLTLDFCVPKPAPGTDEQFAERP